MKLVETPLSWQLLKAVLSIYFVITAVVTTAQMVIEYQHTRGMIQAELVSTERTFYPALATALWELNNEQLQAIQRGIVDLPIITSMRVEDAFGHELVRLSKKDTGRDLGTSITHTFPVTYVFAGDKVPLATVTFEASSDVVLNRVELGYQMILISALIKSAALSLLFVWVFRRRLGVPLKQLSDAVESIDIDSLGRKQVDFKQSENNELSRLEQAFNHMLSRLDEERRNHESSLTALNRSLEQLVEKRTEELRAANENLEQLVRTDTLTGAANRRHFVERMRLEIQRSRRSKPPLSLLMIDLDHFKQINDKWGHSAGDEVLRCFAQIVSSLLRASDLFARLGGEEFAILLPDTDLAGAEEAAQRVIQAARQQQVACDKHQIQYTISIGVAEIHDDESDYEPFLKRADRALYNAKHAGRDRVEVL
ncbi:MAG TPA: diguanylate cyclase [Rhodocyclaceae bacterium]|nr:diguanylate cyclase [Rhodocyclaceae bacterium]